MKIDKYDVAIAGGGPAGTVAALTLARAGYAVAVIETSTYEHPRVGETLPPPTRAVLTRLGLWEAFSGLGAKPSFGNQSAWGRSELEATSFLFSPYGVGWHLDRRRFDQLLAISAEASGATLITGGHVVECKPEDQCGWRLRVECEGQLCDLEARAVIDATGRRAALARWVGAKRVVLDHLVGIVTTYRGSPEPGSYTLVEAVESGWWYSANVPPQSTIITFMTDADLCRRDRLTDPGVFEAGLAGTSYTRLRVRYGERLWGPVVCSAISHLLMRTRSNPPWLAAGDAAMAVDPLSSSGITRALETGEAAALAIQGHLEGDRNSLPTYEQGLRQQLKEYWMKRSQYYTIETRWRNSPFWLRRMALSC
jgi:flavin-dependent dehydrogenase